MRTDMPHDTRRRGHVQRGACSQELHLEHNFCFSNLPTEDFDPILNLCSQSLQLLVCPAQISGILAGDFDGINGLKPFENSVLSIREQYSIYINCSTLKLENRLNSPFKLHQELVHSHN